MSNLLKVSLQTTIYSLADRGWSQRRIASELGINRETVRRYLRLANPAISIAGSEEGADRKPAISITRETSRGHTVKISHFDCRHWSWLGEGTVPRLTELFPGSRHGQAAKIIEQKQPTKKTHDD